MCFSPGEIKQLAHALDWTLKNVTGAVMAIQGKGGAPTEDDILAALDYRRSDSSPATQYVTGRSADSYVERVATRATEIQDALALASWPSIVATVKGMKSEYGEQLKMYFEYAARYGLPRIRDGYGAQNDRLAARYGLSRATVTRRIKVMPEIIARLALSGIYTDRD